MRQSRSYGARRSSLPILYIIGVVMNIGLNSNQMKIPPKTASRFMNHDATGMIFSELHTATNTTFNIETRERRWATLKYCVQNIFIFDLEISYNVHSKSIICNSIYHSNPFLRDTHYAVSGK